MLLLLPTTENKLLTRWQGTFRIERRVQPVDYSVHISEGQTYHVNLLKAWVPEEESAAGYGKAWNWPAEEAKKEVESLGDDPLSPVQKIQVAREITAFSDVFINRPGQAQGCERKIKTPPKWVMRTPIHPVRLALRESLQAKVENMFAPGVLEKSQSPWWSPPVMGPKPD